MSSQPSRSVISLHEAMQSHTCHRVRQAAVVWLLHACLPLAVTTLVMYIHVCNEYIHVCNEYIHVCNEYTCVLRGVHSMAGVCR